MCTRAMETVTHEQIIDAHRRFMEAQWQANLENIRTEEKTQKIASQKQQLQAYQDRLRIMNDLIRGQNEKLRHAYKRIELQQQISTIKEGLKKAKELASRAEQRVYRVYDDLENMSVERWQSGIEQFENNSVFEETGDDEVEDSTASRKLTEQEKTSHANYLLHEIEMANTRLRIATDKCVSLPKRKQELLKEIDNLNKKKAALKARQASTDKNQTTSLKLCFVEFGAI